MKRILMLMLAAAAAGGAAAANAPTYTLQSPGAVMVRVKGSPDSNAWLASNACLQVQSVVHAVSGGGAANGGNPALPVRSAAGVIGGFAMERNKPQYFLGDELIPPDNVDWELTWEYFSKREDLAGKFLFDTVHRKVYVTLGDSSRFGWVVNLPGGTVTNEVPVIASPVSAGRPVNIFWTDKAYGGRSVDLSDKYVKFFGPDSILKKVEGYEDSGQVIGGEATSNKVVVSGLYVDEQAGGRRTLYAAGRITGQVVMAYYDSPQYNCIVGVQTVQISQPEVSILSTTVGGKLRPSGRGYDGAGLVASPNSLDDADDNGPFLYQHMAQNNYSPNHKSVFALRPTTVETRNQTQTWWFEQDDQGVQWPFEVCEYNVKWGGEMALFVRGDSADAPGAPIAISETYQVELCKYSEDAVPGTNHARAPADNKYVTTGAGYSLLKLMANDDVWFMPVRSVMRNDSEWFTLKPELFSVGEELELRGGSASGVAAGKTILPDASFPGYIYTPESDKVWNADLYSESGVGSGGLPSAVFPVCAAMDDAESTEVEVWWSTKFAGAGMPEPVAVPALPQRYRIEWPREGDVPAIVLSSGLGSAGYSLRCEGAAMMFDSAAAKMALPARPFFSERGGAIAFWTCTGARTAGVLNAPTFADSALVAFGNTNGAPRISVDVTAQGKYILKFGFVQLEAAASPGYEWDCVAVSWNREQVSMQILNGLAIRETKTAAIDPALADELAQCLYGNSVGARASAPAHAGRMVDNLHTLNAPLEARTLAELMYDEDIPAKTDVTLRVDLDPDRDLLVQGDGRQRKVYDEVLGSLMIAQDCLAYTPGAPRFGTSLVVSETAPRIYRQTDPEACGYNPNEEHAFFTAVDGAYVVWALRNDLNVAESSRTGVLVEYSRNGRAKMRYFNVATTNSVYSTFGGDCTVGLVLPGPHPLDIMDDPWLPETYWDSGKLEPFRDRKGQVWARTEGSFDIYMYYAQQEDFDWPGRSTPAVGAAVPWLAYCEPGADGTVPKPWRWNTHWPKNSESMKIGQTLTTADGGLPEVWNAASVAVLWPVTNQEQTVLLTDPTVAQSVELGCRMSELAKIGLSAEGEGKLYLYKGKYYFHDVSPSLADRLYIEPSNDTLVLIGKKESNPGGVELLHVNVLSAEDREALKNLATEDDHTIHDLWDKAVDALARQPVLPVEMHTATTAKNTGEYQCVYSPRDHYALTAMGATNWVVLIENDATNRFCDAGNPINMHVFRVVPEYWTGRVVTREDPQNKLSQILGVHYSEAFAGSAGDYVFDWRRASPGADGTVPSDYGNDGIFRPKFDAQSGLGRTSFTIGGQGDTLANMVNSYWICRYRAAGPESPAWATMGDAWSEWCAPPALAEGWVQRVLNNVTPFTQRMTDMYENPAETAVSMIRQAGAPYVGDVALNQDNLNNVGLIQLYRTVLAKAESMSLLMGVDDPDANKQLLLAVQRLSDLYTLLGDEALADAANPTIAFGSEFEEVGAGIQLDYGAASSSLFCFDNQVPSLLDEELALLRGRTCANAPGNTIGPFYNRLIWNFTKGITAGEVAYAINYNISEGKNAVVDERAAAEHYPQGHGDAVGHYLSALQGYYRLMRNRFFSWGVPGMGEMNVADNVVNVDYYDEATFAAAAAKLAEAMRRTVDATALKCWRDNGADEVGGGYYDANTNNAFGWGEWANRGAYGALCNWVTANTLLPEEKTVDDDGVAFADKGLLHIDRGTADGITELAETVRAIQETADRAGSGMNPLGLDERATPFDLTPIGGAGDATHYEQVRDRALAAFGNAKKALDRAQEYANRLRIIEEAGAGYEDQLTEMEDNYTAQLIAIYGKPYADDIGPAGTYPQGYNGPDLFHYMWMDVSQYGLEDGGSSAVATTHVWRVSGFESKGGGIAEYTGNASQVAKDGEIILKYDISSDGVVVKPENIRGRRPSSGTLQVAYSDFLAAYSNVKRKLELFNRAVERWENESKLAKIHQKAMNELGSSESTYKDKAHKYIRGIQDSRIASLYFSSAAEGTAFTIERAEKISDLTVGLATDAVSKPPMLGLQIASLAVWIVAQVVADAAEAGAIGYEEKLSQAELTVDMADREYAGTVDGISVWERMLEALDAAAAARAELAEAWGAMASAGEQFSAILAEGEQIRNLREAARTRAANTIAKMRYNNMFFRKVRNETLAKYDRAFAVAKQYAFLAAKAYGYETGSATDATDEGRALLREIVAARCLGETDSDGNPIVSAHGDAGLASPLAKMDANWLNLKPQLGLNNPQPYATWFSLRHGLFRILKDEDGDDAWKRELAKYWTQDIRTNPEFARHCQQFASQFGVADEEPGLVIPFSTSIDFAYNLFGKPLAFGDSQFDSTWYATKIAAAGVWFEGYNEKVPGYNGATAFAVTPNVYLVPVGTDMMRTPGADGRVAAFDVIDQAIPVPYPFTAAELAEAGWMPKWGGETAGADAETRLRKHPSFRAYFGPRGETPAPDALDATRLTGRSVWNTRWLLVIPAGSLNADRNGAMKAFIHGLDANRDGRLDVLPVSDIHIGFRTYSVSGK